MHRQKIRKEDQRCNDKQRRGICKWKQVEGNEMGTGTTGIRHTPIEEKETISYRRGEV
jgi:hypothetical protein